MPASYYTPRPRSQQGIEWTGNNPDDFATFFYAGITLSDNGDGTATVDRYGTPVTIETDTVLLADGTPLDMSNWQKMPAQASFYNLTAQ